MSGQKKEEEKAASEFGGCRFAAWTTPQLIQPIKSFTIWMMPPSKEHRLLVKLSTICPLSPHPSLDIHDDAAADVAVAAAVPEAGSQCDTRLFRQLATSSGGGAHGGWEEGVYRG